MSSIDDDVWAERFPELFRTAHVEYAGAQIRYTTDPIPYELVSRFHLVAVAEGENVVVCRSDQGSRFLPGGTREPTESLEDLARREFLEEPGAALCSKLHFFSAHEARSDRSTPYRSHLPHPRSFWAYAVAQVEIVGPPANSDDGEFIVEVVTLPAGDAAAYLHEHDPIHADVVRHAQAMGLIGSK